MRVEGQDLHAEGRGAAGDARPHLPHAHQAKAQAAEIVPEELRALERRLAGRAAVEEVPLGRRQAAGQHHEEGHGQVGHGLGVLARGREDLDPALGRARDVDVDRAAPGTADDAQARGRVEDRLGDRRPVDDQRVMPVEQLDELVRMADVLADALLGRRARHQHPALVHLGDLDLMRLGQAGERRLEDSGGHVRVADGQQLHGVLSG